MDKRKDKRNFKDEARGSMDAVGEIFSLTATNTEKVATSPISADPPDKEPDQAQKTASVQSQDSMTPNEQKSKMQAEVENLDYRTIRLARRCGEARSKKTGFVMRPSLYARVRELASELEISLNDVLEEAMILYLKQYNK